MVALVENFEFAETALRGRAQRHRSTFRGVRCLNSNRQANLRSATYDGRRRLESCSKDPIGYVDGDNLYSSYFVISALDPYGYVCGTVTATVKAKKIDRKEGYTVWKGKKNWRREIVSTYNLGEQRLQVCADVVDCCFKDGLDNIRVNENGYTGYVNQPFWLWTVFRTEGEPFVSGGDCPDCVTVDQSSFWYVAEKEVTVGGGGGIGPIDVGGELSPPASGKPFFGGTLKLSVTICKDGSVTTSKSFAPTAVYQKFIGVWKEYEYWIHHSHIWSMYAE